MCDKEFMWALKNGDLDEVKDYVAKVSGDGDEVEQADGSCAALAGAAAAASPGSDQAERRVWIPWEPVPGDCCVGTVSLDMSS